VIPAPAVDTNRRATAATSSTVVGGRSRGLYERIGFEQLLIRSPPSQGLTGVILDEIG